MNYVFIYSVTGALAGLAFALVDSFVQGGLILGFVQCVGMGALGGLLPGAFRQASRRYIPILQSWLVLLIIVFGMEMFHAKTQSLYFTAFLYGYLSHLLWEAYHHNLPRF
jgi:hypothetical protein